MLVKGYLTGTRVEVDLRDSEVQLIDSDSLRAVLT